MRLDVEMVLKVVLNNVIMANKKVVLRTASLILVSLVLELLDLFLIA